MRLVTLGQRFGNGGRALFSGRPCQQGRAKAKEQECQNEQQRFSMR